MAREHPDIAYHSIEKISESTLSPPPTHPVRSDLVYTHPAIR
ncbi:hypothetical protein [Rubritalea tangerina]